MTNLLNFMPSPVDMGVSSPPPTPKSGSSFLEDLLPVIMTGFSSGMALRQRDPEALSRALMSFIEAKEQKRRTRVQEESQRLREQREGRLATMAETNENLRLRTADEAERRAGVTEARNQVNDRNSLINTAEDNLRAMFSEEGNYNPTALGEYIHQQSGRVGELGGDPAKLEALLMSLGTQMSQRKSKDIPVAVIDPDAPPPSVPSNARVVTKPRPRVPREEPKPNAYSTTDAEGNIWRVIEDPRTGREISRTKTGKRPKTGGNDAIDRIIREATEGGGRGAAPSAPPPGKTVTQAELAAIAKKRGTTPEQERQRATAAGYVVR